MKTAIITYVDANNPGAQLQAYALQEAVASITGDVVCQINHRKFDDAIFSKNKSIKSLIYNVYYLFGYKSRKRRIEKYISFRKNYLHLTEAVYKDNEKRCLNSLFDVFISGSDQIWNCQKGIYSPFFLDFVDNNKMKIAYSASMGKVDIPEQNKYRFKELISRYDRISVRESQVQEYLNNQFDCKTTVTCDPVFLLSKSQWNNLTNDIKQDKPSKYIFVFTTEMTDSFTKLIRGIQKKTKLPVISLRRIAGVKGKCVLDCGPLDFVKYIKDSELVVTNSFHATAFSIILHKNFYCVPHSNKASRVISLLQILNLEKRIVTTLDACFFDEILYQEVDETLCSYVNKSRAYLEDALLGKPKLTKNSISETPLIDFKKCFSCRACENICPKEAIVMREDIDGFVYPYVINENCVNCKLCDKTCPAITIPKLNEVRFDYSGRLKNESEWQDSSSGGAFTAFSDAILNNGGYIYGCVYDHGEARIVEASNVKQRDLMRGSKYVQSNTGQTYKFVIQRLKEKKPVLYTGTPCQCAGLKLYLECMCIDTSSLFIMDFICHGSTSPKLFKFYISWLEKKYKSKIVDYYFRPRILKGNNQKALARFENGKIYYCPSSIDPYYVTFLGDYLHKPKCYECDFAKRERVSDITVGDMRDKSLGEGLSHIMINSEKGEALLAKCIDLLEIQKYNVKEKLQPQLKYPVRIPSGKEEFTNIFHKHNDFPFSFEKINYIKINALIIAEKVLCALHLFNPMVKLYNRTKKRK